jgi:glutamate--cysteine ligase catalytic subunit
LKPNEEVLTIVNFPLLGVGQFTSPPFSPNGPIAQSLFTPDEMINPHPRFGYFLHSLSVQHHFVSYKRKLGFWICLFSFKNGRCRTLTQNIRKRRGSKVAINVPLFMDTNTLPMSNEEFRAQGFPALPNHIYMDSMAFGMGQCCLQVTFALRSFGQN